MGKKISILMIVLVFCMGSTLSVSAQTATATSLRGKEINSNPIPICDDAVSGKNISKSAISVKSLNVTASDVWYGWQQYAEGRLLCIEGSVTASAKHYTKTTMQKKSTGKVYTSAYNTGKGKVSANKYDITPPSNAGSYEGRVHYGAL